jgi:hypothetical protein
MSKELLKRALEYAEELRSITQTEEGGDDLDKFIDDVKGELAKPLPEPDAFIVLDSDGDHLYSSTHKQLCHDHINDLLMNESELAGSLVVRGFYKKPPADNLAESYSDALRSLASYVGCGGYNADDPIDAKVFEDKIRYGIDLLLQAQSHTTEQKQDYPERMSDDEIAAILEKLDFKLLVTADDLFYLIARSVEQEAYKRAHGIKEKE